MHLVGRTAHLGRVPQAHVLGNVSALWSAAILGGSSGLGRGRCSPKRAPGRVPSGAEVVHVAAELAASAGSRPDQRIYKEYRFAAAARSMPSPTSPAGSHSSDSSSLRARLESAAFGRLH